MDNFLHKACQDIYSKHKDIFKDTIIVFPNKRAGVFFKKHLNDVVKETIWIPQITTLNEFVEEQSELQKDDNMSLIFKLFNIYRKHIKTEETFDDFYYWGEMLLNDFDDIDKYLVDAKDLFSNLLSLKEIESEFDYLSEEQIQAIKKFWNTFSVDKVSNDQKEFLKLWEKLYTIYSEFKAHLQKEGLCYEGMGYRSIIDKINDKTFNIKAQKILFIGFNALNRCEEQLFTHLQNNKKAEFYWDYDTYYVNNKDHEAGFYMKKNLKSFPNVFDMENYNKFSHTNKQIDIYSVPSDIGQTKMLSNHLKNITENDLDKNAIILGDENLLIPTLHSIPQNIDKINVTMGYPAQNSTVAGYIKNIVDLQTTTKTSGEKSVFYFKQIISILNHQFINSEEANDDIAKIKKFNKVYISPDSLTIDDRTKRIFECPKTGKEASEYLLRTLHETFEKLDNTDSEEGLVKIEKEYLYNLYLSIKRTNTILEDYKIELETKTYYHIVSKIIKGLSIPFEGEPLTGLQVMGLMETRLLDFENLYILSANEGKLPKVSTSNSYVPYNLRTGFGLPTLEHQDSIYAYYFYRLIQRAKNIKFYYSSKSDGIRTGEMSRYLHQLKYESGYKVNEHSVINDISVENKKAISYTKNDEILTQLNNLTTNKERPLSPTAINEYLTCPLKFYFKYIAEMREEDEVTEDIDPRVFGMIFHDSMEEIYNTTKGKEVTTALIDKLLDKENPLVIEKLNESFNKNFLKEQNLTKIEGKNEIIYNIILNYIKEVLRKDKKNCPFKILETEQKHTLAINVDGKKVYIGGMIDRVDLTKEGVRIIDYKSGKADREFISIDDLFGDDHKKQNKAALQTFLYCMMYDSKYSPSENIVPGIYALKDIFKNDYTYKLIQKANRKKEPVRDYRDFKDELNEGIKTLITEIHDSTKPFCQTEDDDVCKWCIYKELCHR